MSLIILILNLILTFLNIKRILKSKTSPEQVVPLAILSTLSIYSILYFWAKALGVSFSISIILLLLPQIILEIKNHQKFSIRTILLQHQQFVRQLQVVDLLALGITALAALLFYRYHHSYGAWDAVAIWNLHASFMFDSTHWESMFDPSLYYSHPDYPLFIPGLIASFWELSANRMPEIPALYHISTLLLLLYIVWKTISKKHKWIAFATLAFLCFDRHFIARAASEYADTTLSIFYLISIIFLLQKKNTHQPLVYLFLGLITSSCMWIKNEGLVFFLLFSLYILVQNKSNRKILKYYVIGLVPILISYLYFKIQFAPPNTIITLQSEQSIIEKLSDSSRYRLIVKYLLLTIVKSYPIIILATITAFYLKFSRSVRFNFGASLIIAMTLMIYLLVYLLTPYQLEWHIKHSITRLIHQLYPSFLVIITYTISIFFNKKEAFIF